MASKTATKALIDTKIPDNTSGQVTPATERDAINAVLDMVTASPVGALSGLTWNLADDGYKKTLTLTADTTVTVIIEDGADGFLFVTGAGHTLTVGLQAPGDLVLFNSIDIATAAVGVTGVVVSNAGGFMWAEGRNLPTPNINPPAPTNGVVDDTNNTFAYTIPGGYVLADVEGQINGGAIGAVANPMVVGNVNAAIGQVRVRIKAAPGRNASTWLANATAFTAAGGATIVRYTSLVNGAETSLNSNAWQFTGTSLPDQYAVDANHALVPTGAYDVWFDYAEALNNNAFIGLNDSSTAIPAKDVGNSTLWNFYAVPYSGNVELGGRNSVGSTHTLGLTPGPGVSVGLRISGSSVSGIYTTDGGATVTVLAAITGGLFPSTSMFVTGGASLSGGRKITNPRFQ